MRHVYSIVRFVPNPANGECVNLGLLAGCEDSEEWILQTLAQRRRARQLGGGDALPGVMSYLERLTAYLEAYTDAYAGSQLELPMDREPLSEQWLASLASRQRGVVQFTEPSPVDVESAEAAVDLLWEQMVVEPSSQTSESKPKNVALGAVRGAFRNVNITEDNLWRTTLLDSSGFRAPIDFAVHNGRVAHLTQCWSFQRSDNESLIDEVQSWSWAIRSLRTSGGVLRGDADLHAEVARDVSLAVVYVPAASPEGEEAFEKASRAFRDPEVDASLVVGYSEASDVAQEALAALQPVSH